MAYFDTSFIFDIASPTTTASAEALKSLASFAAVEAASKPDRLIIPSLCSSTAKILFAI
jgi:hypothetical protein